MATLKDLEALGYIVADAQKGVSRVKGFGISTMVENKDKATIDALANSSAHAERAYQHQHGRPSREPPAPDPDPLVLVAKEIAKLNPVANPGLAAVIAAAKKV